MILEKQTPVYFVCGLCHAPLTRGEGPCPECADELRELIEAATKPVETATVGAPIGMLGRLLARLRRGWV